MTHGNADAQTEFAQDVVRNRDHALYWLSQEVQGRNAKCPHRDLFRSLPESVQLAAYEIGRSAVDEAIGGLLCSLWSDDRYQLLYKHDDGLALDLKRMSDGWHGDFIGFGTHGGWIHEYSKYGIELPRGGIED